MALVESDFTRIDQDMKTSTIHMTTSSVYMMEKYIKPLIKNRKDPSHENNIKM